MEEIKVEHDHLRRGNKYIVHLRHPKLNEYKMLTGQSEYEVRKKAESKLAQWDGKWAKIQAANAITKSREEMKDLAIKRTEEAREAVTRLRQLLSDILGKDNRIYFESLKDSSDFNVPKPDIPQPKKPVLPPPPTTPKEIDYQPKFGFLDNIFKSRKEEKIEEAEQAYIRAQKWYQNKKRKWDEDVKKVNKGYALSLQAWQQQAKQAEEAWEKQRQAFLDKQAVFNAEIDKWEQEYINGTSDALLRYFEYVLDSSEYPEFLPDGNREVDFNPGSGILVVDYQLPSPEAMPKVKEVKYVQSRDAIEEMLLPASTINSIYDEVIYQIVLRTVHELYQSDTHQRLQMIVFNGWVNSVDKSTGQEVNACIISLQANREEFSAINLSQVDPKACFKKLKGVGSSKLHGLAPIAPIMQLTREDKRFVSSYNVADTLNEGVNLAAMDWEDFEHLIRELFEKEFMSNGGEVKVTQASRDGGVDAIAFDPDPIRGGKIVIQAKRYTNTVGVSAVRDLYGTVVNEGATKGILVSTADYGPDAYEFANGKPITLLNGGNLLHLLEKHGHKARIDLQEAKLSMQSK